MKRFVWLSFDLGVKGDYEGMYRWLDYHGAKECGDSMAYFEYEYSGNFREAIKKDLNSNVQLDQRRNRIYIVWKSGTMVTGRFIVGSRRSAPWAGYSGAEEESDDTSS